MKPQFRIELDGEFIDPSDVLMEEDYIRECIVQRQADGAFDMGVADYMGCETREDIENLIRNGHKGIDEMDMDEVVEYINCKEEVEDIVEGYLGEEV